MEFNQSEFLCETIVPKNELIVSRTNLQGIITYANDTFCEISGYKENELIGQNHNILRHPDMPKAIFEDIWKTLQNNKVWVGVIKNLRKDKGFYWIQAQISSVVKDGEIIEYKSVRTPINYKDKLFYQKKYDAIKLETKDKIRKVIYE